MANSEVIKKGITQAASKVVKAKVLAMTEGSEESRVPLQVLEMATW